MYKKILSIILIVMSVFALVSCTNQHSNNDTTETVTTPSAQVVETTTESPSDVLEWADCTGYMLEENVPVKNIILMIGDGMGENIIKNSDIVKGSPFATAYMPYSCYVGTDSLSGVTDSAASSTAISCGVKTKNKYIGMDENGNPVETIVEFAKARGLKTGLVATQIIPHATPAGMVAHNTYRDMFNDILKQMVNAKVDVMFGGGAEYADTSKMQKRIEAAGYNYIKTSEELETLTVGTKALGAFSYNALNAGMNPSLTTMTSKALELLDNDNGFFLMVEASHIDIYEAQLDMDGTIAEMKAFDKAIDYTLRWAESHPGTLVLVTADHETGGVIVPESGLPEDVNNDCFTSGGEHTGADVKLFAAGAQADKILTAKRIENTEIAFIMRKVLNDTYGEKPVTLLNQD